MKEKCYSITPEDGKGGEGRRQKAEGRRQKAEGRGQRAEGREAEGREATHVTDAAVGG